MERLGHNTGVGEERLETDTGVGERLEQDTGVRDRLEHDTGVRERLEHNTDVKERTPGQGIDVGKSTKLRVVRGRDYSPDLILPEEFVFSDHLCVDDDGDGGPENAVKSLSEFPYLDNESEVSGKQADRQPECCMLSTDDVLQVEQKESDQIILPELLPCGDDSALDDCILEEEFDSFPKLGFLNVLEEEEEEDEDDEEDYEAEFWFEKSVNENDEERFTLKTVGAEEDRNASDKDCSSPAGEQVEEDCSDSEKDYSRPPYGQAQNDDNINLDEDFIKLFEQAEDDLDISDKEFASMLGQAQDNQVISDKEFANLLEQSQDNQAISVKEFSSVLKQSQDNQVISDKEFANLLEPSQDNQAISVKEFSSVLKQSQDNQVISDKEFANLLEPSQDNQAISVKEFSSVLKQSQDNQVISNKEFTSVLEHALENQVISSKEFTILLEKHEQDHKDSDKKPTCNIHVGGHVDSDKDLSILCGKLKSNLRDPSNLEVPIRIVENKCCTFNEDLEHHKSIYGLDIPIEEDVMSIDDSCQENASHPDKQSALGGQEDISDYKLSQKQDGHVALITRSPQKKCHLDVDVEEGKICLCTYFEEKHEAKSDKLASGGQTRSSGGQTRSSGGQTRSSGGQTRSSEQSLSKAITIKFDTVQGSVFSDKLKHFQINDCNLKSIEPHISSEGYDCGGMDECNVMENETKEAITKESPLRKYGGIDKSSPIGQHCFCCENDTKRPGDEQSLALEKLFGDQVFDNEADREFFGEDTESNFSLCSGGLVYGCIHNDSELPSDTDQEKELLQPDFPGRSLNRAEIEQKSTKFDNRADGAYESMKDNRKMEGSRSAWFTGIYNPAFFSDELAEETNGEVTSEKCAQSSKPCNRLCCLNSSLPTVVIEDCVSDGINFVEDIDYGKEVSYEVYEEIDSHISNLANRSGLNVAGNGVENVLMGLALNAPMDVNGDVSEDAMVDLSAALINVNQVTDVVLIGDNDTKRTSSDPDPGLDNFPAAGNLKEHVQRDKNNLPCDKPVPNNVLRSSSSIIRTFEKEVHLIYSKYKDTAKELPSAVKINPPEKKVHNQTNAHEVLNNLVLDECLRNKDALDLEMLERKPIEKRNPANLLEDALKTCKQPERQKDQNCKKNIQISFRIIGDNSKDAIVANVYCCGKFCIDEIKTSDDEWHGNDEPGEVKVELAVKANSGDQENTGTCLRQVSPRIGGLENEKENNSTAYPYQKFVGPLRNEEENVELSQNRGTAQEDSITEFCGGCSQMSMVFNENKDTSELNAEQELQHFADIARSDSEYIVSLQESFEKNAIGGEYLESSVALLSTDHVAGGEAQGLAYLETSTPMESMEISLISENRILPPTSVLPDHLSSSAEKPETSESQAVPSKSVTKTVCLRLEPGQELDKVIKPSDVAVTSSFVVDDVSDTVVCSSSFYGDSIQATVTSTLNLGIPSLEVDIALQKQNSYNVDGSMELGDTSGAAESSFPRPPSNWLIPVVTDRQAACNPNQAPSTFFHHIAYSDIVTCIFNFVDVLFWICLAVAIIIFDFRNWSV